MAAIVSALFVCSTASAGIAFTDEPLTPQVTPVKAVHITELRTAVNNARATAGLTAVTFSDAPASAVTIKALHITELRSALDAARSTLKVAAISYADSDLASGTAIKAVHIQQIRDGARVGAACSTVDISNPSTSTFTVNDTIVQQFVQNGALNGAIFSIGTGTLPAGMTLSSSGVLGGTPTVTGSFPVTVRVTDGNGCTGVGPAYPLSIVEAPAISSFTVSGPAASGGPITLTGTFTGGTGVITNDRNSDAITVASGSGYDVSPTLDTTYTLTVTNAAGRQLASTLTYVVPARLRINELNANIVGGCDMIELRVLASGNLDGLSIRERTGISGSGELNFTFPAVAVVTNDIIVVHLNGGSATCNPGQATSESLVTSQPSATFVGNYDTAFDFWDTDTGLTATDNVFTLRYSNSTIMDAVFVSDDAAGTTTASSTETAAAEVGVANEWSPAMTTYVDAVFRMNAVDDLNATGTSRTGTTIQRIDNTDDNNKADWTTGAGVPQTWGLPNPGQ